MVNINWWLWTLSDRFFFLDQHGCAKNQVDGELLIGHLSTAGWKRTDDPKSAQLIIVNSCGFIESAKTESLQSVLYARQEYSQARILLAGCLAERYSTELTNELPEADGFLGNGDLSLVTEVAESLLKNDRPVIVAPQKGVCCGKRPELLSFTGSTYVKITEGCNNRCSFCAIPIIRGELRSLPIYKIISEIQNLFTRGIREINLIGQDLASYGKDFAGPAKSGVSVQSPLAHLLHEISALSGDFWIRLLYIHPDNFPHDILPVMQSDPRILPYFDIPFQSGDDHIILKMNRHGTAETYRALVASIRQALPQAVLRTTFLTGFPAETARQFQNTAHFLESIEPDWSGCFAYSKEDDTPAADMDNQVSKRTADQRKKQLEILQESITQKKLLHHLDQICDIFIEEIVPVQDGEETGFVIGRAWFQAPEVDGAAVIRYDPNGPQKQSIICGNVIKARITGINGVDIEGFML